MLIQQAPIKERHNCLFCLLIPQDKLSGRKSQSFYPCLMDAMLAFSTF
ncbi:hypothetical protein AB434_1783 [Heyndrickxia coagulans]|uniref:Uncharacterized protein n=1 Tax=Heyndrickxia coagulans TaxID=1398 RepID=A0A0C5CBY0_HEYCO|nr:hypothetical protein SB48_HM08orf05666 [Heyndrickxia coagulans]AKN54188.1 hypothetical protein AB434_1783 [Heyndrickxia coagulans]KWZ77395.1 hypothetical protein HMPREF3213_03272 [Heyndrickxia coagulans]KYC83112.1 hypothetical protein B4096_0836 [Heyndrickxia coagulans]